MYLRKLYKSQRRKLFAALGIIPLFCFLFLFGESFFLFAAGGAAKLYFRLYKGWELDYASIQWKNKGFVFTDLSLEQPSFFSLKAPLVSAFFQTKHLVVERPDVFLYEIPEASSSEKFHWTLSVVGGTIEGAGLQKGSFSFEKSSFENEGLLRIDWDGSSILVDASSPSNGSMIDVTLEDVHLSSFRHWIGKDWSGVVHGSFHFSKEGDLWSSCGGCLEAKEICCEGVFSGISGNIDWECPLGFSDLSQIASISEWEPIFDHARLRVAILDGDICLDRENGKNLRSVLSFDGKSGAKWEFSLLCSQQKIEGSGRGFLHSLKGRWVESELRCDEGVFLIQGRETAGLFTWDFNARSMNAATLCFLQDIAALTKFFPHSWVFKEGLLNGCAQITYGQDAKFDWTVSDFSVENLRLESDLFSVSCKKAHLKEGVYSFHEGSCLLAGSVSCIDWNGECDPLSGIAKMSGKIGEHIVDCEIAKKIDSIYREKEEDWFQARCRVRGKIAGEFVVSAQWKEEALRFVVEEGGCSLFSIAQVENLQMWGDASREGIFCYEVRGICDLGKKIPFYCPVIASRGPFDIRFENEILHLVRFAGEIEEKKIALDQSRSHICGVPISVAKASFSDQGLECLQTDCTIPWKMLPFFFDVPSSLAHFEAPGLIECRLSYEKEKGVQWDLSGEIDCKGRLLDFLFCLQREDAVWRIKQSRLGSCCVDGILTFGDEGIFLSQAKAAWHEGNRAEFTGKLLSLDDWSLNISRLHMDLQTIPPLQERGIKGIVDGEGHIYWKESLESDFDVVASHLSMHDLIIENAEPLHLFCSSKKGVFVRGINLSVFPAAATPPTADCKMGLLQYDLEQSLFVLTQCQLHLASELMDQVPFRENIPLAKGEPLYLTADVAAAFDFSHFSCSMKEANLPLTQGKYHVQNFHLEANPKELKVSLDLDHQNRWIPMDLSVQLNQGLYHRFISTALGNSYPTVLPEKQNDLPPLQISEMKGRLIIENGMKIDWRYTDRLTIETIEGKCLGVEAAFHREEDSLIGSARFNCNELKSVVPPDIAQVFQDLKMGDGYELMGRIYAGEKGVLFNGILSGKQIELFGFQLKNLLAKIELASDHVHISDVKISDFAGVMKIDQILAQGVGDAPWTISIPHIKVTELRPSLLQEVGGPPGKLSPLVVRSLEIRDFKGFVEDSKTYTAQGELFFINSYKREKSILEIPSDVLSRIVGLDLDLMIPVCGTLRYELREGLFHFTELEGSYSENKRSEFFLVYSGNSPTMDLDWNLHILIQMKQFVLFKFTESFIIYVDGKLDDPKFHLQRRKRFL